MLWKLDTSGRPSRFPLAVKEKFVSSVAFSPDGQTIAAGLGVTYLDLSGRSRGSGGVALWDVATLKPRTATPIAIKRSIVASVTFSPDSKTVVAGLGGSPGTREHGKGGVVLLDADTGKSQLEDPLLVDQGDVLSVVYSPDGKTIAAGFGGPDSISSGRPGGVVFWDADTPHQSRARQLDVKEGEVVNVDYSNDGRTIATAYHVLKPLGGLEGRGGVVLWDADSGQRKMSPLLVPEGDVTDAAFSSDGKALVVGYHVIDPHHSNNPIGGVVLLDVTTGHRRENTPLHVNEGGVTCLAFRPHENMIAVGFRGSVLFYDSEKTQRLIEVLFTLKEGQIGSVACSPDARRSQRHIAASTNSANPLATASGVVGGRSLKSPPSENTRH